ncbi:MAG: tRNA threonylcarbamoyladenosine dehydratase [Ignavibacteriae bacterium HGW-Ignavibacteriae-2]|jgi:tRNA A37 threonylcarbamoyladenosine dehydratase|nr:MAG: tRNA threonylcarbamoyladenosine dehydratase [Ignavibacteriae bacterium HGW-Ignavibacteriae-2]
MSKTSWLSRTELLVGKEELKKLKSSNVLVVGLGGVGGYAAEQLCRAGIGKMTIVDGDKVISSNINRQLIALHSTIDKSKTELLKERLLDINPKIKLTIIDRFVFDHEMESLLEEKYDYVVDAIDTLAPKFQLIYNCMQKNIPVISSMGAGGKFDPLSILVTDISKSFNCNLARVLRKRLYKVDIRKGFKVVFSTEKAKKESFLHEESQNKKSTVGTISYMPPVFGCVCASVVIRDLLKSD